MYPTSRPHTQSTSQRSFLNMTDRWQYSSCILWVSGVCPMILDRSAASHMLAAMPRPREKARSYYVSSEPCSRGARTVVYEHHPRLVYPFHYGNRRLNGCASSSRSSNGRAPTINPGATERNEKESIKRTPFGQAFGETTTYPSRSITSQINWGSTPNEYDISTRSSRWWTLRP